MAAPPLELTRPLALRLRQVSAEKSFVLTAAAAGVSYLWRNRQSLRSLRTSSAGTTPARGVTIYDNHPVAE